MFARWFSLADLRADFLGLGFLPCVSRGCPCSYRLRT